MNTNTFNYLFLKIFFKRINISRNNVEKPRDLTAAVKKSGVGEIKIDKSKAIIIIMKYFIFYVKM